MAAVQTGTICHKDKVISMQKLAFNLKLEPFYLQKLSLYLKNQNPLRKVKKVTKIVKFSIIFVAMPGWKKKLPKAAKMPLILIFFFKSPCRSETFGITPIAKYRYSIKLKYNDNIENISKTLY